MCGFDFLLDFLVFYLIVRDGQGVCKMELMIVVRRRRESQDENFELDVKATTLELHLARGRGPSCSSTKRRKNNFAVKVGR